MIKYTTSADGTFGYTIYDNDGNVVLEGDGFETLSEAQDWISYLFYSLERGFKDIQIA